MTVTVRTSRGVGRCFENVSIIQQDGTTIIIGRKDGVVFRIALADILMLEVTEDF